MALRDDLLPDLDELRGIAGELGFRPFTAVEVVKRVWSGVRPGVGSDTVTITKLSVAGGSQPPKVRSLSAREIVASGGDLTDEIYEVGPLTPTYGTGGTAASTLQPPKNGQPMEIYWRLTDREGTQFFCETVSVTTDRALRLMARIKRTGKTIL